MIAIYNYLTEANFKDVVSKTEEKGYPIINPESPVVFISPKGEGDIFLKSVFNIYNKKFESSFTTRAHEKELGVTLPSGDKKFEQFLVDKEPIAPLMGTDFASTKKGLWSVEKEIIPNNDDIWEIKGKPELVDGARTIPQFMILGGTANSGKSKLLTIIKKMMGLYGSQNWYLYSEICQGDRYKASKTIEFMNACMIEENVNPFLVDELDADFFSNQNRGENLIVNTSNFYDNNRRQMPAFIGTTNALDYSMNERGKSRTYYLKIDRVFDDKLQKHSLEAFKSLLDEINDKLFQDFIVRFSNKLSDDSLNWAVYSSNSNTGSVDFLYYAREIFKEYFEIAGIRLPEWFPLQRYDDKKETDKELWRKQYEYHKEKFKISSDGTIYLFNLKELDEYEISNRYGKERKPSDFYRQSMPQKHLVTTSGTDIIEIKVDSFHKWIGVDKPKTSLFKKLFQKKRWKIPSFFCFFLQSLIDKTSFKWSNGYINIKQIEV